MYTSGTNACKHKCALIQAEHKAYIASDPAIAAMFDIKRGYKSQKLAAKEKQ